MKSRAKLSDITVFKGNNKIRYYVIPDSINGFPLITVCLVKVGNIYTRGIAICSPSERENLGFVESIGKTTARYSAFRSYNKQENIEPIIRDDAIKVIKRTMIDPDEPIDEIFKFKGSFDVKLTEYEKTFIFD